MWTSTLELDPKRILLTQLLGRFWPGAYFSFSAPLRVQNVPRESLAASHWVRVRNRLAGICGSDLHLIYAKGDPRVAPAALPGRQPVYLGHEVVGEVIEVGDEVQHLRIGDRVVLQYHPNCLSSRALPLCHFCATGNYNFCERGELPDPAPLGGGWSEEMLLPEQQLFRVPADLSDEQAVMLEPAAVALHAVLRRLPQAGEHVLVIGAGTIGLLTVAIVRALAPQVRVSVLARYPFQIEQATRLGAEHIIYTQDSYQGVQQATQAEVYQGWFGSQMMLGGFDVIYDTIGSQSTLHHALRWARAGSALVLVGIDLHLMHIDMTPLWYQEISLLGSLSHGIESWPPVSRTRRSTFDIASELIMQRRLAPEQLITHRFALTDYQHALTTAAGKSQNRAIKIIFDYALLPASVVPNVRASARPRRPASNSEQWSDPDPTDLADEKEPPESKLAEIPRQFGPEKDPLNVQEEDTEKVPAIKKIRTITPEEELAATQQEITPEYSTRLEPPPAEEVASAAPTTQMSSSDEIEIAAEQRQSELLPEEGHEEFSWASRASKVISGDDHHGFSWASRASEAISGDSYQGFSPSERERKEFSPFQEEQPTPPAASEYATESEIPVTEASPNTEAIESEAETENKDEPLAEMSELPTLEVPVAEVSEWLAEAVVANVSELPTLEVPVAEASERHEEAALAEVEELAAPGDEVSEQEVPVAEIGERETPITDESEQVEETPVAEVSKQVELEMRGRTVSEIDETPTESMSAVEIEERMLASATDESVVSAPVPDEQETAESEQNRQDEPVQPIDGETSPLVIVDEQTSNNADDQPATDLADGKARRGTRKKRATKEGSDALEQVDATPDERKRSRPRARKKSQAEEEGS
jgi:threonine dehydrogenase-like Zn-dependent dehydrogenase